MLIPILLLNLAVVTMFFTAVSFSGLMIWRESKHSHNTTTVRPTTKPTGPTIRPPTRPRPTISPPTRPRPTISPPTWPGPTISPPTRPGPTISPPPGPTTNPTTPPRTTTIPSTPPRPTISPPLPTPPPNSTTLFPTPSTPKPVPEQVCETEACKYADSVLNRKVRRTAMPCNDFYYFACGKMESTESDELEADIVLTKAIIEEKYHDILRKPETAQDIKPVKLAKRLYTKCNEDNSADTYVIGKMIIDFVALYNSSDSSSLLKRFYEKALGYGYLPRSLFIVDMATNKESQTIILIRNPSPSSNFYAWPLDTMSLRVDTKELENVLIKGGNTEFYRDFFKTGYESEEQEIADAYSAQKSESHEYSLATLESEVDLQGFPLKDIINKVFAPILFPTDQKVRVECITCLKKVWAANFVKHPTTLRRHLTRHALADHLLQDFSDGGVQEWLEEQAGTPELIGIFKNMFCSSKIVSLFKKAMDYEYIRNYVDPKKKDVIAKIIDQSKTSLKTLVKEAKHLDESAKDTHFRTIDSLKYYTPLDGAITDNDDITKFYAGLHLDPVSYGQSLENVRKHVIQRTANEILEPSAIPIMAPQYMFGEKSMHYDVDLHSVYLSVAALQDIFLSMDRSEFLNFGGFGSIIGHALSQSVDSKSSKQAEQMSLVQSVYLGIPMDTDKNGDNATECFVNSLKKHGNLTADEMNQLNKKKEKAIVYESDGVQIAYHAYMNVRADLKDHQDQVLPSFVNYSDDAMFFLSYASMACSTDALLTNEKDYIRAYGKVNVVAKTSVDFDRAFGCEVLLNEKCNLWLEGSSKKAKLNEHFDLFMR